METLYYIEGNDIRKTILSDRVYITNMPCGSEKWLAVLSDRGWGSKCYRIGGSAFYTFEECKEEFLNRLRKDYEEHSEIAYKAIKRFFEVGAIESF